MSGFDRAIHELLEKNKIFVGMYDLIRMVDPEKGALLEYGSDGKVHRTEICCTDVFGSAERCRNCTSTRAYYADKTMVKLEYAAGTVLLIHSIPVPYNGGRVIVEMVKDISDSMTVDVKDRQRMDNVTSVINDLNRIATTDALTGLFNRRYLDEHLPSLVDSCKRLEQPMCLAMIDLDHFKRVNDTYGHEAGDVVLSGTAKILASFVRRGSDWCARYGGEEFFVCFVGSGLVSGVKILERIRQHIEATPITLPDGQTLSVTASIGAAELHPDDNLKWLLKHCDDLLYQAKRNGRNRVEYVFEVQGMDGRDVAGEETFL